MNNKQNSVLTQREERILELAANGADNSEIAKRLYVSTHTIKAQMSSIFKKLQAANRTHAACLACKANIIQISKPIINPKRPSNTDR